MVIRRDDAGESPLKALNRKPAQKFGLPGCDSIRRIHNLCSEPESACRYHTPASCLWTLPPRNSRIRLLIGRPGAPCMAPSDFPRHETHAQPQIEQSTPNDLRNTESRCRGAEGGWRLHGIAASWSALADPSLMSKALEIRRRQLGSILRRPTTVSYGC